MYPVLFETLGDPHVKVIGMPLIPSVNCYFVTSCCSTNWRRFDTCAGWFDLLEVFSIQPKQLPTFEDLVDNYNKIKSL